jgi:hypothetical protein
VLDAVEQAHATDTPAISARGRWSGGNVRGAGGMLGRRHYVDSVSITTGGSKLS